MLNIMVWVKKKRTGKKGMMDIYRVNSEIYENCRSAGHHFQRPSTQGIHISE